MDRFLQYITVACRLQISNHLSFPKCEGASQISRAMFAISAAYSHGLTHSDVGFSYQFNLSQDTISSMQSISQSNCNRHSTIILHA